MLGSLIIFASVVVANSPNSVKVSDTFWLGFKSSENTAKILWAKEMSLETISIFEDFVKALTIGNNE